MCVYMYVYVYRYFFSGGSVVKNVPADAEDASLILGREEPEEKEMATHSSILAWKFPWPEELGGLQAMGSQRPGCILVQHSIGSVYFFHPVVQTHFKKLLILYWSIVD